MIVLLQTMGWRGALINNRGSNTIIQESNFVENSLSVFWKLSERDLIFFNFCVSFTFDNKVCRIIHSIHLISFGEVCFTLKICYRRQCMSRYHTSMLAHHSSIRSFASPLQKVHHTGWSSSWSHPWQLDRRQKYTASDLPRPIDPRLHVPSGVNSINSDQSWIR